MKKRPGIVLATPDFCVPHRDASEVVSVVEQDALSVPQKPTVAMLAAGAKAGGVSVERAWRIYKAMLRARR
jgi:hypothetical protein